MVLGDHRIPTLLSLPLYGPWQTDAMKIAAATPFTKPSPITRLPFEAAYVK